MASWVKKAAGSGKSHSRALQWQSINPNLRKMQFGVYGELVHRAASHQKDLDAGKRKPFQSIIMGNVGDSQAMHQKPITWIRQVLACATYPPLLNDTSMPVDVKRRTKELLSHCQGNSVGSYAEASGVSVVRRHAAQFLEERDGVTCDPQDIILTTGATEAIKGILSLLNDSSRESRDAKATGVMIPIPQYPVYSATLCEYGMAEVGYYLDESNNWQLDINDLERAFSEGAKHCIPKAIVIINPGNPTGSVLQRTNLEQTIQFAYDHQLAIIADEVYMHNIYDPYNHPFCSVRHVMASMGIELETFSLMSASKGFMGECGIRGGLVEMLHVDKRIKGVLHKSLSAGLGGPVLGQLALDCILSPPQPGDESHSRFESEKETILNDLAHKARMTYQFVNSLDGMSVNAVSGSIYAFPSLQLPRGLIERAIELKMDADLYYLLNLLDETGICLTPGSSFGQKADTWHFRSTILPQLHQFESMLTLIEQFNDYFIKKFS